MRALAPAVALVACLGALSPASSAPMPAENVLLELSELFDEDDSEHGERELRLTSGARATLAQPVAERELRASSAINDASSEHGGFERSDFETDEDYDNWPTVMGAIRKQAASDGFSAADIIARQTGLMPKFDASALAGPKGVYTNQAEARDRLNASTPLMWMHVPKCGSSFSNALVHLPNVCPGLPKSLEISDRTFGTFHLRDSMLRFHFMQACRGNLGKWGDHGGIKNRHIWNTEWNGAGLTTIRQPEARIVSAFNDNQHSWPTPKQLAPNLHVYAKKIQGCLTRMLTQGGNSFGSGAGHWGGPCGGDGTPPTRMAVETAKKRIVNFTFVGIQEYWPLSICLLHAKLGGPCYPQEFLNSRHVHQKPSRKIAKPPGLTDRELRAKNASRGHSSAFVLKRNGESTEVYSPAGNLRAEDAEDEAEDEEKPWVVQKTIRDLRNFKDVYDREVYDVAVEKFTRELAEFNVNEKTCKPCFDQMNQLH